MDVKLVNNALDDAYKTGYEDGKKDAVTHAYWRTKEYGYALLNVNDEVMWLAGVPCSRCGITGQTNWKYCPNCGAIMDAEEDTQETHKED